MANNNSNNGNMFDIYGMQQIADMIKDAFQQNYTLAQNDFAKDAFKQIIQLVKNPNELTKKDIELVFSKYLTPLLKGTYGGGNDFTNFMNVFKTTVMEMQRRENMTAVLLSNLLSGGVSLGYKTSESAVQNGEGNKPFKIDNPKDTLTAKTFEKIFGQSKLVTGVNAIQQAVFDFFNWNKGSHKKRVREFIDDLMDGLSKSKFVGGALTDLIRLATFFAANWLKQFGPIGKALAVGLVALGPIIGTKIADILVKSLVGTIGNVFKAGLLGLGTLLKSAFLSFTKRNLLTATLRGAPTVASKAISSGNLALGSALAAVGVRTLAADSFKKGDKTSGGLLALGSAGFGVAGAASLLAPLLPVLAPVAPIAIAVATIATGIGLIVKFFPQIMDFFKKIGEWLGIIAKKDEDGNYQTGARTLGDTITGYGGQGATTKLVKNPTKQADIDAWNAANTGSLNVSETGLILNAGQLTQENLSKRVSEYVGNSTRSKEYSQLAQNYDFIRADDKHVSAGSFETDAVTEIDGIKYIIAPKGTYSRLLEMDEKAKAKGIDSITQLTGGIKTAGRYQGFQPSYHEGKEHSNLVDAAVDFVSRDSLGRNITDELNKKGVYREVWGKDAYVHGEGNGITGQHAHMGSYASAEGREIWNLYKQSAKENKTDKKDWAEATQKSLKIANDDWNKAISKAQSKDSEGGQTITDKEAAEIEVKRKRYQDLKEKAKLIEQTPPEQFYTGNELLSSVLKDSLILQQYQSRQQ